MTKQSTRYHSPKSGKARSSANIKRAIKDIRVFHEIGRKSTRPGNGQNHYGQVDKLATEAGLKSEQWRQARKFAKAYTETQLDELCELIDKFSANITRCFVVRFATIGEKKARTKFQKEAAAEGWTMHDVNMEIRKRFGQRQREGAGRRHRQPENTADAYWELSRVVRTWQGLYRVLAAEVEGGRRNLRYQLPKGVKDRVRAVKAEMDSLDELLNKKLP